MAARSRRPRTDTVPSVQIRTRRALLRVSPWPSPSTSRVSAGAVGSKNITGPCMVVATAHKRRFRNSIGPVGREEKSSSFVASSFAWTCALHNMGSGRNAYLRGSSAASSTLERVLTTDAGRQRPWRTKKERRWFMRNWRASGRFLFAESNPFGCHQRVFLEFDCSKEEKIICNCMAIELVFEIFAQISHPYCVNCRIFS